LHKFSVALLHFLLPLGLWGVGALALIDSALIPIPVSMDGVVIGYVATNRHSFLIYCLIAAAASSIGSLVPFLIGRAGGELFLLKRINRARYERIRDRFENQEFLAIMIPAMMPPPMPVKIIEFAAGVFEMKPLWFFGAIFVGKFVRFLIWALITIFYGPAILETMTRTMHHHLGYVLGVTGVLLGLVMVYVIRKLFNRRRGTRFPVEEDAAE